MNEISLGKARIIIYLFLLISSFPAFANDTLSVKKKDIPGSAGLVKDSVGTSTTFTNQIADTASNIPLARHGSIFLLPYDTWQSIGKEDISLINYSTFSEILFHSLPVFPLSTGGFGQFNSFNAFGAGGTSNAVTFDGRPVTDPEFGSLNLEQIAPEFMERAEIMVGSDAAILSANCSGILINIQEIRYNTDKPYTRLWLTQAGYDLLGSDGIFSQNIIRNTNFTFGYRNISTPGRYQNQWLSSWNIRAMLRWNPTSRTNISISEIFTNHGFGTNGGVDPTVRPNIYDELDAVPVYTYLNERVFRHDITLTVSSLLGEDSAQAVSGSIYASTCQWDQSRSADLMLKGETPLPEGTTTPPILKHITDYYGASAKYEQSFGKILTVRTGGDIHYYSFEPTPYIAGENGVSMFGYGHLQIEPVKLVRITCGARISTAFGQVGAAMGGSFKLDLSSYNILAADIAFIRRTPTPAEGIGLEPENIFQAILQSRYVQEKTNITLNLFSRYVASPIVAKPVYSQDGKAVNTQYSNSGSKHTFGAMLDIATRLYDRLFIGAWVTGYYGLTDGSDTEILPKLYCGMKAYYEFQIGNSMAQLGFDGKILAPFKGEWFIPQTRSYIAGNNESILMSSGLDLFANARLGSAFIRIIYQNVFSRGYYYMPYYPQLDRNFRLTVSWSFFD